MIAASDKVQPLLGNAEYFLPPFGPVDEMVVNESPLNRSSSLGTGIQGATFIREKEKPTI